MDVRVAGLRRSAKNIAHNYTEPQKKVREATSNDAWGPSTAVMSEISEMTYHPEAFQQIMEMLWKRLNDSGKNWRHVYKSLILIEYLIKNGNAKVAQQCAQNIYAIQTLKNFQHYEEGTDQGFHVRERAKQLVFLLGSDEKLKAERDKASVTRERVRTSVYGQTASNEIRPFGRNPNHHPSLGRQLSSEIEAVRPSTQDEEELQLQVALAMSKEEADRDENQKRNDDLKLQMALSQSERESLGPKPPSSSLLDLDDDFSSLGAAAAPPPNNSSPWGISPPQNPGKKTTSDPWNSGVVGAVSPKPVQSDPWKSNSSIPIDDPWSTPNPTAPLAPTFQTSTSDPWQTPSSTTQGNPQQIRTDGQTWGGIQQRSGSPNQSNFLGDSNSSKLVNFNNLVPAPTVCPPPFTFQTNNSNPFSQFSVSTPITTPQQQQLPPSTNPFQVLTVKPSLNELRQKQQASPVQNVLNSGAGDPFAPQTAKTTTTATKNQGWVALDEDNNF